MAAATFSDQIMLGGLDGPRRRKRSPITFGRVLVVIGVLLVIAIVYLTASRVTVSDRPNDMKTTTVILPPPPPPPPPPETQPVEKPPEPTIAPPLEQPVDTPPPPEVTNEPVQGDSALTAREGAGPSNYGLAGGDGGGTRIGGRPGGGADPFGAYANAMLAEIRRAAQLDTTLGRGRWTAQLAIAIDGDGRITRIRVLDGTGDSARDSAFQRLVGTRLSRQPPASMPVMRIELSARSGT